MAVLEVIEEHRNGNQIVCAGAKVRCCRSRWPEILSISVIVVFPAKSFNEVDGYMFKVSNMVESLEQELADITESGDFAAYQVLLHTIQHFWPGFYP